MKTAKFKNLIMLKRPVITIFLFYAAFLVVSDYAGLFLPQKQSFLYYFTNYYKTVSIEGKVISEPEKTSGGQKFFLKASKIGNFKTSEKILVNSPVGYKVSYGDIISVEGTISKPKGADFPLVFDYGKYLARLGVYTVIKISSFEYIESRPNTLRKLSYSLQKDVINKIDNYFKKPYAAVLKPLIIGDKSALDRQTKLNFVDAGLMHILVVSGLHVGFVGAFFLVVFKLFAMPLKKASLLSIPFVFLYVLATGANPPALRAAIMLSCVLISLALDREPLIYNSLAFSALLILIFQPQQLFTASFQMSYAATIGIVYCYSSVLSVFSGVKNKILRFFCGVFSVTVSAQVPLIPICMFYFGKVSLISFFANIIIVPAIGIIIWLAFLFFMFTFIFSYVSLLFSVILSGIINLMLAAVNTMGSMQYASMPVPKPSVFHLILYFAFMVCATAFRDKKRFIFPAAIMVIMFFYLSFPKWTDKNKLIFNVYGGQNMTALQLQNKDKSSFLIYQNKRYDGYYVSAFNQFLSFSGIKGADITAVGVTKEKDFGENISNNSVIFARNAKPEIISFDFDGNDILFDMKEKQIYINGSPRLKIGAQTSFYFDYKNKSFKIKNARG